MNLRAVILALLLALPAFAVHAAPAPGTFADPQLESRARNLQRQLRCLVCQGESIDESRSDFSVDLRQAVREQIAAGKSDQQIQNFMVARYGDFVLMKPPVQSNTWLLWLGPLIVLLGAGGVATVVVLRARRRVDLQEPWENA